MPPLTDDDRRLPIDEAFARRWHAGPRALAADDFVRREVAKRLAERLDGIRLEPATVVDLACGTGADLAPLRARFAKALVIGLDASEPRLTRAAAATRPSAFGWFGRRARTPLVAADFGALPFAARSIDCLHSNLALPWSATPHRVIAEWSRVATVGGLVLFSTFGPDTLREVRDAFAAADGRGHVLPFTDMHDYGDMLVDAGFVTPVVDAERVTLTYREPAALWRDVRSLGVDATVGRSRGLHGRAWRRRLDDALERGRDASGQYRLTLELVFAHAWKGEPRRTAGGEAIVRIERNPASRGRPS